MKNIWVCEICGKEFNNEGECVVHEEEHLKEKAEIEAKERNRKENLENLTNMYKEYLKALKNHEEKYGRICMYSTFEDLLKPFSEFGFGRSHRNGWYI